MNVFIDCEFNGAAGALISLGIVSEDGKRNFYEVVDFAEPVEPWVKDNVLTIVEKPSIPYAEFQKKLFTYLEQFPKVHFIADHPEDIARLCRALIISGGEFLNNRPYTFEVDDRLSAKEAKVRHNAFHDADAMRKSWFKLHGFDSE